MSKERESLALPAGTQVGRYRLRRVETTWGFYLTYLAEEMGSGGPVFVHELLPEELVQRTADGAVQGRTERAKESMAWARERFVLEGRGLSACTHPGIQKILAVFEANGTAYWVTPVEDGRHFKRWLQDLGRAPTEGELRRLLDVLLPALQQVHAAGLHHLNLKPETIQIAPNEKPVLVHFAGSRQAIARHSHAASAVTTGYSPIEQYDEEKAEGAWTDIYSLAAVLYRAITGHAPPEATLRLPSDPYERLAGRFTNQYSTHFLTAIDAALATGAGDRPRSIEGWQRMFGISGDAMVKSFVRRNPRRTAAGAAVITVLLGMGLWRIFSPKPTPPIDDPTKHDDKRVVVDNSKKDDDRKRAEEEEKKKAEEAKEEEQRKAEEEKLAEAQRKAEADKIAAEKAATEKAAKEKQLEEDAVKKEADAKAAAEKAEAADAAANQATRTAVATKDAALKKAANKVADEALDKAADARATAGRAAREYAAAEVAAKRTGLEKANAERAVAEKTVAQKTIEEELAKRAVDRKTSEVKAASDPAAAEKAAAGKNAAEQAAQKIEEEKATAGQMVSEKIAAEKAAFEALGAAQTVERNLAVKTNPPKNAEEKAAAEKAATEAAAQKVAEEKAAMDRAVAEKKSNDSSQGQGGGPPPPAGGDVGQVGSGLGGIWETMGPDGKPVKRLIIYPDAYYELITASSKDSGIIRAKLGNISMDSEKTRATADSTFKYKSMSVINTDGALGKLEWVRVSANTPERTKDKKE